MSEINKLKIIITTLLALSGLSAGDFKADQPVLITAAGQSADVLMVKVLAQRGGLNFTMDKLADADVVKDYKSVIIVSGGSTKGLGAAKIDKDDEIERVKEVITAAKKAEIPIITMHVGGKARRGNLSDEFNLVAAEAGVCLVVVEGGDEDGFFNSIAEKNKAAIIKIKQIVAAQGVLQDIFSIPTE